MSDDSRITHLEEHIAHQSALLEELNDVVTDLRGEVDALNRRVEMLLKRAAEQEADDMQSAPLADQRPPHW